MARNTEREELGIREKITKYVAVNTRRLAILVMIVMAVFGELFLFERSARMQEAEVLQLSNQIEGWFGWQSATLDVAADTIQYAYKNQNVTEEDLKGYLAECLSKSEAAFDVYAGFEDGHMYYGSGFQPADSYDPRERGWYQGAKEAGETYVSEVYLDYQTGKYCVTISKPIYNENQLLGVVGIDIYTEHIDEMANEISKESLGYMIVIDRFGNILSHKNPNYVPRKDDVGDMVLTQYQDIRVSPTIVGTKEVATQYRLGDIFRGVSDDKSGITVISAMNFWVYFGPLFMMLLISLLLLLLIRYRVKNMMQKTLPPLFEPLNQLFVLAENMSMGFLEYEATYQVEDEIGMLCVATEQSNAILLQSIQEITERLDKVANGDLTDKIHTEYCGDFVPLKVSVNNTILSLRDAFQELKTITDALYEDIQRIREGESVSPDELDAKISKVHEILDRFKIESEDV